VAKLPGGDRPLLEALDQCCAEARFSESRRLLLQYIEGFHAADPARVSTEWLVQVEKTQPADASAHHAIEGVDRVLEALMPPDDDRMVLQLNTVVQSIAWSRSGVTIEARRDGAPRVYHATRAVCTLPLAVLKAGSVHFDPPLSRKQSALAHLEMGHVLKLVFRMRRPFWQDLPGLRNLLFLHDFDQPFPTWWTTQPLETSLITGWAAGPRLAQFGVSQGEGLLPLAVRSLAAATSVSPETVRENLEEWHCHDWGTDPFALGGYSYVLAGGTEAWRTLAEPLDGSLFFAGEATVGEGYNATMEGAFQSGMRAAREILDD
jgi:monoamine oxidase